MRWILIAALVGLTACGDDGGASDGRTDCLYMGQLFPVGASWPAGDGCNGCYCDETQGFQCSLQACADADPAAPVCGPNASCPMGPMCGFACCGAGERCVGGACMCNTAPACGDGDSCEPFGPGGPDGCGSICCGASGPCPQ